MVSFEKKNRLKHKVFRSCGNLESIKECSGDSCGTPDGAPETQDPWRRDAIVAGLTTSHGRIMYESCNQQQCEKIRERWHQHVERHHPEPKQFSSISRVTTHTQSLQANLNPISSQNTVRKSANSSVAYKEQSGAIPQNCTETPKNIFYKQRLLDVVLEWYLKIPVFPTMNDKVKLKRLKVINALVDNIEGLSPDVHDIYYANTLRRHIEVGLDKLPMWYPGAKIDKIIFRNNLCKTLLKKIEKLNEKWLFIKNDDRKNFTTAYNVVNFPFDDGDTEVIKLEISNWVDANINIISDNIDHQIITNILFNKLMPVLNSKTNRKRMLQAKIINVLHELSGFIKYPNNKTIYSNKLANDLSDRLLRLNYDIKCGNYYERVIIGHCDNGRAATDEDNNSEEITNIHTLSEDSEEETFKEVSDIYYESIDGAITRCRGGTQDSIDDICEGIKASEELTDDVTANSVDTVEELIKYNDSLNLNMECQSLSGTLVVLTSEHDFSSSFNKSLPLTSTPLFPKEKKQPEKLNCCEKNYMNKVASAVREWLGTTDMKFNTFDNELLKETIAHDIASEVKDLAKLSQIQVNMKMSYFEGVLAFIIMRAILKYGLLSTPPTPETRQVIDFKERIINLGMPDMMTPQHGNRQTIANIKFKCDNLTHADFKADPLDILEDNISVWLNEQPSSTISSNNDNRERRNKLLEDVARKVQEKNKKNASEEEIKGELREWLKQIVNPRFKGDIDDLAEDLKDKVLKLPQNETINKAVEKKAKARAREDTDHNIDTEQHSVTVNTDIDEQLKDFMEKFIEQNYNVSDSLARGAFANILLQELLKLSPNLRKDASNVQVQFNEDKLRRELEYIEEVSDWLKSIPFYPMLASGNERVGFVNGLAKNIADIEEERAKYPGRMDYEKMLHVDIFEFMTQLPIPPEQRPHLLTCVNQLRERIARHRAQCCAPQVHKQPSIQSIKNERDFAKFVEEFLNLHSKELGDDPVKLEAYLSRLLKEIKQIVLDKADALSDAQVYDRLADVPMPGKESIQRFDVEMKYANEVADWLHNFPLKPLRSREEVEDRMKMISDLAEKMTDIDLKMAQHPNDPNIDKELDDYIINWISKLDLNPNKEIVVPILIAQLRNRMANIKRDLERKLQPQVEVKQIEERPTKGSNSVHQNRCNSNKSCSNKSKTTKVENPGDLMVQAIESWCKKLPIKNKDEDSTKVAKAKVATSLFQKVGLLNVDPRTANDDLLYRDMLADEIEKELQKLSDHKEVSKKRESLKKALLDLVMETKKAIKDMSAGENYKQTLESSIDASLPNPVHTISNKIDPGYELYKTRMVMLWILENYDYSTDFYTLKYKKKLNEDIDKYSAEAQKRNVFPMDKYEVFNQIFSALYKENAPSESSIVDEVQNIKLRCEIGIWIKELPLKKACGLQELLERDQILALLAKRLYDIEKTKNADCEEKIRKEILKWLKKLPFLPGEEDNFPKYVDKLLCNLKATADIRKCKRDPKSIKNSSQLEIKDKSNKDSSKSDLKIHGKANKSQIAGPSGVTPKSCCEGSIVPRKKAGDLITAAVETWCKQLPLKNADDTVSTDHLKDVAIIKMYQILSDLHNDPNILNNEGLYENHLNVEIEKLLSEMPGCCELQQTKNARRQQLIRELLSVRPLIKDDLDREEYKQDLKNALSTFLDETTNNKIAVNENVKNYVIDNFIEYSFHNDDFDDKQIYKLKINEVLADILLKNKDKTPIDPLLTGNHLISEMSKIKAPKASVLMAEVQEIRMKNIVRELLNEIQIPENDEEKLNRRDQMKLVLAKKLVDYEKAGDNCSNRRKIKIEIDRAFKKLGSEISPEKVDAFINNLNKTDGEKNTSSDAENCSSFKNHSCIQPENANIPAGPSLVIRSPPQSNHQACPGIPQTSGAPLNPISTPQSGVIPFYPKISTSSSSTLISLKRSENSEMTANEPPNQSPNIQTPGSSNPLQNPDLGTSSSRIAFREQDQERPVIVNGLSNTHLKPSEFQDTRTTIKAQDQDGQRKERNAATVIEAKHFNDCKCTGTRRMPNCKGKCKQNIKDYCDCESHNDCNCGVCFPIPIPGFVLF